jgi:hypothetical protein
VHLYGFHDILRSRVLFSRRILSEPLKLSGHRCLQKALPHLSVGMNHLGRLDNYYNNCMKFYAIPFLGTSYHFMSDIYPYMHACTHNDIMIIPHIIINNNRDSKNNDFYMIVIIVMC